MEMTGMQKVKKVLNEIFIDGLGGMASGLFATLIIGTIIQQVGNLIPGSAGEYLFMMGKAAAAVTGAGIGCGVAVKFKESPLVTLSAATTGMVGAFAGKIIAGTVLVDGAMVFAGPGEPLGAFLAAVIVFLALLQLVRLPAVYLPENNIFDFSYYGREILSGIQRMNADGRIRDFSRICAVYLCAETGCLILAVPLFWAGCRRLLDGAVLLKFLRDIQDLVPHKR